MGHGERRRAYVIFVVKYVIFLNRHQANNNHIFAWWRHQMGTFTALLALCAGNSPVPGEFPVQRPVTRSFDVFFHLRPNKRLSIQSWGWWSETLFRSLRCHCNGLNRNYTVTWEWRHISVKTSQITSNSSVLEQIIIQFNKKQNIKAPHCWSLWRESTGDQWILLSER